MAIESKYCVKGSKCIFRDNYESEANTRRLGGVPTDVIYSNGVASFNGSSSKITFTKTVRNIKTVRIKFKPNTTTQSILKLTSSHSVSATAGTLAATGFSSPTIYVNGGVGTTITTNWNEVVITTATGINANALIIGQITNYYAGLIELIQFFPYVWSASEVANAYANKTYKELADKTSTYEIKLKISSNSGIIKDLKGQTITNTGVQIVNHNGGKVMKFNGTSSKLSLGNLGVYNTISLWFYHTGRNQYILTLDNGTTYLNVSSNSLNSFGTSRYVNGINTNTLRIGWNHIVCLSTTGFTCSNFIIGNSGANYSHSRMDRIIGTSGLWAVAELIQDYTSTRSKYQ